MPTHPTTPGTPVCPVQDAPEPVAGASQASLRQQRHHRTPNGKQLTERELEILTLAAGGHTNTEIGAALYITVDTVKTHMRGVFAKLGARDRAHAVSLAHRQGLLGDQDEMARLITMHRVMRGQLAQYEALARRVAADAVGERVSPAQVYVALRDALLATQTRDAA